MTSGDINLQNIAQAISREGLPWTASSNELTALTDEERRSRLGLLVSEAELRQLSAQTSQLMGQEQRLGAGTFAAPAAVDWRNNNGNFVTPVKNQLSCGSCVAFCTCATIESAIRIKLNNPGYNVDLSEGFCQFCGGGSCSGWGLTSGLDFARATGITDEACMPYQPQNMVCSTSRCADWQNRLTKIASYASYATMDARKNAIATIGPVLAGMAVYNDFYAYSNGVYVKTASATLEGYHCICVVGYDDAQQCWILKNSWGANWGEGGFVRVRYDQPDLLIDTQWAFSSVDVVIANQWHNNIKVNQAYASRDAQNAWAYLDGLGWRRIQQGSADGVTNMLTLFAQAVAKGAPVTVLADGTYVYQAYLS